MVESCKAKLLAGFLPALNQNRTDDLILTMDVLCQLSYKGITPKPNSFWEHYREFTQFTKITKKRQ